MRRAPVALALSLLLAVAPRAWADAPSAPGALEEARAHYDRGRDLYEHGHYAEALIELRRANELAPSFRIQRSIGLVQGELGDYAGAIASLERYLETGGDAVGADQRKETSARIAAYRQHVGALEIAATPPGAAIVIDGAPAGAAPLVEPALVNAGHHTIRASLEGYVDASREVDAAAGDRLRVELALQPRPAPPPAPPPEPAPAAKPPPPPVAKASPPPAAPPQPTPAPHRHVPWIGWTAAGALAAGAVVTGVVALSASSELRDKRSGTPTPGAELDSIATRAKTLALVSDLCTAAAVVAGGLSLYFTLVAPAPARDAGTAVRVGAGPGRVFLDVAY